MQETELEVKTSVMSRVGSTSKHIFVKLAIDGLDEELSVSLTAGQLGVNRIIALKPQPLNHHFSVVWNGDTANPKLHFDGAPIKGASVLVEVWGA